MGCSSFAHSSFLSMWEAAAVVGVAMVLSAEFPAADAPLKEEERVEADVGGLGLLLI